MSQPPTVDRELDVFRSGCTLAINKWRIPVKIHPMAGLGKPQYHNERDRRLVGDEYDRLIAAAYADDRECAIEARVQELLATTHPEKSATKHQRAKLLAVVRKDAENSYQHVAWYQTFIEFQLMAGPRGGETLNLKWSHVNLEEQTAFLPETKNGNSRTLPLRANLVALLRDLPRLGESDTSFSSACPSFARRGHASAQQRIFLLKETTHSISMTCGMRQFRVSPKQEATHRVVLLSWTCRRSAGTGTSAF